MSAGSVRSGAEISSYEGHRRKLRLPSWCLPLITVAVALCFWEIITRADIVPSRYIPPMSAILVKLAAELVTGSFWSLVGYTLRGWALGLGIAMGIGIPIGVLLGSSQLAYRSVRVVIEFLRPMPSVALIPLAVLVFGIGLQSEVFLAAFAALWPVLVQTLYGVADTDPVAVDTGRAFGLTRWERLYRIKLPSALPYIVTGVRISSAVSLILAVTAELIIGSPGLGQAIEIARQGTAYDLMYALIIATGLLGYVLNIGVMRIQRRLLHWHQSQRRSAS
jgi:ABC-type nitrate/sulfonate/bicarbonate transport system permease component